MTFQNWVTSYSDKVLLAKENWLTPFWEGVLLLRTWANTFFIFRGNFQSPTPDLVAWVEKELDKMTLHKIDLPFTMDLRLVPPEVFSRATTLFSRLFLNVSSTKNIDCHLLNWKLSAVCLPYLYTNLIKHQCTNWI